MTKDEALDLALEALEYIENNYMSLPKSGSEAITAIKQARALDKKAENARELGLDYEPEERYTYGTPLLDAFTKPAPVQEPFGYVWFTKHMEHRFTAMKPHPDMGAMNIKPIYTAPPGQEPVAYTTGHCKEKAQPGGCQLHNLHCGYPACDRKAVTTPPAAQRQWVGLTDDEFENIELGCRSTSSGKIEAMQKVEAKLKEKNGGVV
jgi:hypothetical protein